MFEVTTFGGLTIFQKVTTLLNICFKRFRRFSISFCCYFQRAGGGEGSEGLLSELSTDHGSIVLFRSYSTAHSISRTLVVSVCFYELTKFFTQFYLQSEYIEGA